MRIDSSARSQRVIVGAATAAAIILRFASGVCATPVAAEMPRVRSTSGLIAALVEEATERSDTFRQLVDAIGATNGIVYVHEGRCRHGVRSCLDPSITSGGGFRILHVVVSTRRADTFEGREDLMGSIGHELHHATEVLAHPTLDTMAKIYFFYSSEGSTVQSSFETPGAIGAGERVRSEIATSRKLRALLGD